MIQRIAILGTGLLGTSVGLAMKAAGFKGSIAGWNRNSDHAQLALQMGALDAVAAGPIDAALEAARAAQVVVLAMPIYATLDFMEKLSGVLGCEHLVTDVGSTKRIVSETAAKFYNTPQRAAFLPGHPMAGKERGGAELADANLFRGAVWLFTPITAEGLVTGQGSATGHGGLVTGQGSATGHEGLVTGQGSATGHEGLVTGHDFSRAEATELKGDGALAPAGISKTGAALMRGWREWVAAMGAKTLDLDPVRHDELVAWVSHLPQFTATALSALLEEEMGDAPELRDVGGRALREMTRLGASPYSMWRDIAYTNTEPLERALAKLEQRIAHLRENLRTPGLRDEFVQANKFRKE